MHPEEIKAAIRMKGYTASVVADHMDVSRSTVAQVISGRATSARIKNYIAEILGLPVETVWPPKPALVLRRPKIEGDKFGFPEAPVEKLTVSERREQARRERERREQARRDGERRAGVPA